MSLPARGIISARELWRSANIYRLFSPITEDPVSSGFVSNLNPLARSNGRALCLWTHRFKNLPIIRPPEDPFWHPIVAVPARNEAQRIPALIRALGRQTWLAHPARRLPVVILLNNCTDHSFSTATTAASNHPNLMIQLGSVNFSASDAHVGTARRLATEIAFAARPHPTHSVVMMTDADATPEPDWVEANLRAVAEGADLVGGLIVPNTPEQAFPGNGFRRRMERQLHYARLSDRLASLIDPLSHDPWPRHGDHTGASIAVRAAVYAKVGGVPALSVREDLAFVSLVRAAGYRVRHPLDVRVRVSARTKGRAFGGMADCLRMWASAEAAAKPHLVEDPTRIAARLRMRRRLRMSEEPARLGKDGRSLDVTTRLPLSSELGTSIPALLEALVPDDPDAEPCVPIERAIVDIGRMLWGAHEARI
jgi:hypothetical protein